MPPANQDEGIGVDQFGHWVRSKSDRKGWMGWVGIRWDGVGRDGGSLAFFHRQLRVRSSVPASERAGMWGYEKAAYTQKTYSVYPKLIACAALRSREQTFSFDSDEAAGRPH